MTLDLDRRRFFRLAAGAATWLGGIARVGGIGRVGGAGGVGGLACGASDAPGADPLAWRVHQATRNTLTGALGRALWPHGSPPARAKPYPGRERVALPDPPPHERADAPDVAAVVRGFAPAPALADGELPLDTLARLLHLSYGLTGSRPVTLRAAPSAGALYAGEVYVAAQRVAGLAPGVYSYHVPDHALVRLADGEPLGEVAAALERPGLLARAPVAVLLTNVFHRYTHRYRNRGYRYALIDSGHIGENLRLAAATRGLGVVSPLRFHDAALDALVGVDGASEAVCALHAVGAAATDAPAEDARALVESQRADPGASLGGEPVPRRYHAATRLVPGSAPDASADGAPGSADAPDAPAGPEVALPEGATPAAGVDWSIRERRSARRFLDRPIALTQLSTLLAVARGAPGARLSPHVGLRIVAHRVSDLAPGVYHHDPARARLVRVRAGDTREALHDACLRQDKARSAGAAFAVVADVGAAAARGGDRAYRDVLLEAGALAQRLYVGAESLGLAARNLAAFFDDALNALLRVEGERAAVVHLTMVGAGD